MRALLLASLVTYSVASETLFQTHCATCHTMKMDFKRSELVAPPLKGLSYHLKYVFTPEKMKAHIVDFVYNPTKAKATCMSVRRFGLMPSLKGALSPDELEKIAHWMTYER